MTTFKDMFPNDSKDFDNVQVNLDDDKGTAIISDNRRSDLLYTNLNS